MERDVVGGVEVGDAVGEDGSTGAGGVGWEERRASSTRVAVEEHYVSDHISIRAGKERKKEGKGRGQEGGLTTNLTVSTQQSQPHDSLIDQHRIRSRPH